MSTPMKIATVKWFNPAKGFGFLIPEPNGSDVFVHANELVRAGLSSLSEGQRVSYQEWVSPKSGKVSASKIVLLPPSGA